jgi:hypothetical protein
MLGVPFSLSVNVLDGNIVLCYFALSGIVSAYSIGIILDFPSFEFFAGLPARGVVKKFLIWYI